MEQSSTNIKQTITLKKNINFFQFGVEGGANFTRVFILIHLHNKNYKTYSIILYYLIQVI